MTHDFNNGMYKPCATIKIVLALQCDCIRTNQIPEFQMALVVKNPPANAGDIRDAVQSLGRTVPWRGAE